jgi:hypothetical protein
MLLASIYLIGGTYHASDARVLALGKDILILFCFCILDNSVKIMSISVLQAFNAALFS